MSLHFIIDGYNTVRHDAFKPPGKIKDPVRALESLILSQRLCGSVKNPVTIVFDGYPQHPHQRQEADIVVVFSRELSADDKIKKMVESARNPKGIVVVSDDLEIRAFIKGCGAISLGVEDFLGKGERKELSRHSRDPIKPDLSYTQMDAINKELRKLWL